MSATEVTPADLAAVKEQVRFYFSDANWHKDRFFRETCGKYDGWMPMATLLTFNRLSKLTVDPQVVLEAVNELSELIEVSEDKQLLRKTKVPEARNEEEVGRRTVRAKVFGKGATLELVRPLFAQFGNVEYVKMPVNKRNGEFIGRLFVEFDTRENAEKAVAASGTLTATGLLSPDPNGAEQPLTIELIEQWHARRPDKAANEGGNKKKRATPEDGSSSSSSSSSKDKDDKSPTPDLIVHYRFESDSTPVDFQYMKQVFQQFGEGPAYVSPTESNAEHEGDVRMKNAADALAAVTQLNENPALVNDRKGTFHILKGDEEKAFWEKYHKQAAESGKNRGGRRGGSRGGSRGGRRGGAPKRQRN